MPITLTVDQIRATLPLIENGLGRYQWLQRRFAERDACEDPEFRRRFNGFYRVRFATRMHETFFNVLEAAREPGQDFAAVLQRLSAVTGRFEASFSSKIIATVAPTKPVIDAWVLQNVQRQMPRRTDAARLANACVVHQDIGNDVNEFLASQIGRTLVALFDQMYPESGITNQKKVDLVLWQTRPN